MAAIDEKTKTQIDLLKSIYEARVNSIHSRMNYTLAWLVGIATVALTYSLSVKPANWFFDLAFGITFAFLLVEYTLELDLEVSLSRRLGEHIISAVKRGQIIGDFEDAADELFDRKPRWMHL